MYGMQITKEITWNYEFSKQINNLGKNSLIGAQDNMKGRFHVSLTHESFKGGDEVVSQ